MCQGEAGIKCPWNRQTDNSFDLRQGAWRKTQRGEISTRHLKIQRKNSYMDQMESKQRRQDSWPETTDLYENLMQTPGLPRGLRGATCLQRRRRRFDPWVEVPGRREWCHPGSLPGNFWGGISGGAQSMESQESWTRLERRSTQWQTRRSLTSEAGSSRGGTAEQTEMAWAR